MGGCEFDGRGHFGGSWLGVMAKLGVAGIFLAVGSLNDIGVILRTKYKVGLTTIYKQMSKLPDF